MSGRAARARRSRADLSAIGEFSISANDALAAVQAPEASSGTAAAILSVDSTTSDRRRIYREQIPIPVFPLPASNLQAPAEPSINAPPLTVGSIPDWAPFFCEDVANVGESQEPEDIQEQARRYTTSVSPRLVLLSHR